MHVPDGFLDVPTSLSTGAIAIGAVGLCLRRADAELRRSGPALAGLTAAFVFAVQMVNFPVGAGTSGHLLGGALAAALVGPWTAVSCLTVVLVVQALLFADGGLTALGTNVLLMAVVTVLVGYGVSRALVRIMPRRPGSVVPAAALGALVSVPAAAGVFVVLYSVGGAVDIPLATLAPTMVGWHAIIGIGEAVITGAVLSALVATRPDLVHLVRAARLDPLPLGLESTSSAGPGPGPGTDVDVDAAPARANRGVLGAAGLVTLIIAGVVSLVASGNPDGLEFVAGQLGFDSAAVDSVAAGSPLAGYGLPGSEGGWATAVVGVLGVLVTVLVGVAVAVAARRGRRVRDESTGPESGRPVRQRSGVGLE